MVQTVLFTFLLFALPLLVFPFGASFFETPKIFAAEIGIEVLVILSVYGSTFIRGIKTMQKQVLIALGVIFLLSLVDLVFFKSSLTLFGNIFRLQGVFLLWHMLLLAIVSSQIKYENYKYIPLLTLIGLIVETVFFGVNQNGRFVSGLGEPNAFAATLIFLLPFILSKNEKWVKWIGFGVVIVLIAMTGSRSGLIALGIESLFFISVNIVRVSLKKTVLISLILLFLSYSLPFIQYSDSYENRALIWKTAVVSTLKSPVIGSGFGNIEKVLKETSQKEGTSLQYAYVDSTHNIFLDWMVEGGIVGVVALIILIGAALQNFIHTKNKFYIATLLGLLTCLSFNPGSIVSLVAFWWLIGQGLKNIQNK